MDALIGIYVTIVIVSLSASGIYIYCTIPHWCRMQEKCIQEQLAQAKQTTVYLEQSLKIAEAELVPLEERAEEIFRERYKRGERDFHW